MAKQVVGGWFARVRLAGASSTVQARARPDGRQAVAAKASVPGAVGNTPLPARVLAASQAVEVTWRRQGRRDVCACSRDGHGDSRTGD